MLSETTNNNRINSLRTSLARVEELCQARFEYNKYQLSKAQEKKSLLGQTLGSKLVDLFDASLKYAMRQYLTMGTLIKRNDDKVENPLEIQPFIDDLYFLCFLYHAQEQYAFDQNNDVGTVSRSRDSSQHDKFLELDSLKEIKTILKPFISQEMTVFIKDHTLSFKKQNDSVENIIPQWIRNTTSFLDVDIQKTFLEFFGCLAENQEKIIAITSLTHEEKKIAVNGLNTILGDFSPNNIMEDFDCLAKTKEGISSAIRNSDPANYCKFYRDMYKSFCELKDKIRTYNELNAQFFERITSKKVASPDLRPAENPSVLPDLSASQDHRPEADIQTSSPPEKQEPEIPSNDLRKRIELYRREVQQQREIRALDLKLKKEKLAKAQQERNARQQTQKTLSEPAQAKQQLEVAFIRLWKLSHKNLDSLEKIVGMSKQDGAEPDIGYASLENLFAHSKASWMKNPGKLGWMESSGKGGSHRKITLPALSAPITALHPISDAQTIDRLGFFDYTVPSPREEVKGTAVRPHGSAHTNNLCPAAIESIRATLGRAGINAMTLDAFQKAKAMPGADTLHGATTSPAPILFSPGATTPRGAETNRSTEEKKPETKQPPKAQRGRR